MSHSAVQKGLESQLAQRRRRMHAGERPIGWKAGFGARTAMARFGLSGPLVGFMMERSLIGDDEEVDISAWANPVAEPELAVHLGEDLTGQSHDAVRAAVSAIGPAIELADIDPPPEDVEGILTSNIFHRGVLLGSPDPSRRGANLDGLEARVTLDGIEQALDSDLEALTGRVVAVVSHLAALLADHGEVMREGEVVICGSLTPPVSLGSHMSFGFELSPLAPIGIRTA